MYRLTDLIFGTNLSTKEIYKNRRRERNSLIDYLFENKYKDLTPKRRAGLLSLLRNKAS